MLVFLLTCFFFQTLRGAPITPNSSQFLARESPAASEQQHRTSFDIIQACFVTILACVWQSVHPNLNGPRDSGWACMKRKVVTMFCGLIAPEVVLLWALHQRSAARKIAKQYNDEFAPLDLRFDDHQKLRSESLPRRLIDWFHPLPKETTWRGAGQQWTNTHGFFIQMGGFILYSDSYPVEVLTYERVASLLEQRAIDAPTVTERELQDRSKGDWVSKGIIVLQMTWFVVQCLARAGRRLPLSELEVLTLALALMNVATYAAWWDKPQGADTAICVPWKTVEEAAKSPQHEHAARKQENGNGDDHGQVRKRASWKWLRRQLRFDRDRYSFFLVRLLRLPYLLVKSILHPLGKMNTDLDFNARYLRVPMFYTAKCPNNIQSDNINMSVAFIIGTLFGAVHLLAWSSEFACSRDLVLWRVSAVILTVTPVLGGLYFLAQLVPQEKQGRIWARMLLEVSHLLFLASTPCYIAARVGLIFVAFNAFRNTRPDVLVDVAWTSYLPHL